MSGNIKILVVDDDRDFASMVAEFLRLTETWNQAAIAISTSYDDALRQLTTTKYDVAFFDYMLGARDGLSLLREVRERGVDTPIVVLTGHGAEDVAVESMKSGAADYLSKTHLSVVTLERTVRHAIAISEQERHRRQAEIALRASGRISRKSVSRRPAANRDRGRRPLW